MLLQTLYDVISGCREILRVLDPLSNAGKIWTSDRSLNIVVTFEVIIWILISRYNLRGIRIISGNLARMVVQTPIGVLIVALLSVWGLGLTYNISLLSILGNFTEFPLNHILASETVPNQFKPVSNSGSRMS